MDALVGVPLLDRPGTRGCELSLTDEGNALSGSFACPDPETPGSDARVDLLGGALGCEID